MKKIYLFQSVLLLAGTLFAWFTVYSDFSRFYDLYGSITRITDCIIPNPVTTACFYGAFAFLGALIWSLFINKASAIKKVAGQRKLHLLLIGSTIFAFSNLFLEIYNFYFNGTSEKVSCSGVPSTSIFVTPCFIGSMFFLGSLITSMIIIRKSNTKKK
ncbi:MAG: hypothetical protein ACD_61C00047G0002 [uncultured bacterium]|nr:MAG: hypothetical protein ACD_61C00047G0002 [uncultured bacterium]